MKNGFSSLKPENHAGNLLKASFFKVFIQLVKSQPLGTVSEAELAPCWPVKKAARCWLAQSHESKVSSLTPTLVLRSGVCTVTTYLLDVSCRVRDHNRKMSLTAQ